MNEIPNFNSPNGCRFVFVVVVFFFHLMLPLSIVGLFVNDSGNWERKTEYKRKKNTNFYSWFMGENRNWPAFSIITNQILSQIFFYVYDALCVCFYWFFYELSKIHSIVLLVFYFLSFLLVLFFLFNFIPILNENINWKSNLGSYQSIYYAYHFSVYFQWKFSLFFGWFKS